MEGNVFICCYSLGLWNFFAQVFFKTSGNKKANGKYRNESRTNNNPKQYSLGLHKWNMFIIYLKSNRDQTRCKIK